MYIYTCIYIYIYMVGPFGTLHFVTRGGKVNLTIPPTPD